MSSTKLVIFQCKLGSNSLIYCQESRAYNPDLLIVNRRVKPILLEIFGFGIFYHSLYWLAVLFVKQQEYERGKAGGQEYGPKGAG